MSSAINNLSKNFIEKPLYYQLTISECFKILKSSKEGLSKSESLKRLHKYGENILDTDKKVSKLKIFLVQFKDFIIYLLFIAALITIIVREYLDTILILVIIIINSIIGFFQEYNAIRSINSLKKLVKVTAKVYRNNELIEIDSKYLVPGDIVLLEAGDKVPADGRIIECNNFSVEESALTGESKAVSKIINPLKAKAIINDQKNMVFMGTKVVTGNAKILITSTGEKTELGKISKILKETKEELTPLQIRLEKFGKFLSKIIIFIAIFIFLILILKDYYNGNLTFKTISNILLVSISLMVAAVPTGLPIVVTVALSVGVKRLAKKKALVKKLSSVETLGSCNVICTDKTGTLTKNEMTVKKIYLKGKEIDVSGSGYSFKGDFSSKIDPKILEIGYYCNNSIVYKKDNVWQIIGDPTEAALKVSAKKFFQKDLDEIQRISEIPFDSKRKMMSVLLKDKNKYLVYVKGALDIVLEKCSYYYDNGKIERLNKEIKEDFFKKSEEFSKKSLRVLAFAYKEIDKETDFNESKLVFVGLQAMMDPPREEVKNAIKKAKEAGIRVIMITGDYRETAKAIGKEVGITGKILTGKELENLNDDELSNKLKEGANIFARVSPEDKLRIVDVLQRENNVVAMTGDGVNDAPALKKANIGIAVGSGTEVAKDSADLVLLDDGFHHIINAVEEGRGIYNNIQKSIQLLLSGNLTEVLVIFLAVIFSLNLPLTAVMLLWINMLTDGAPAIFYSFDSYSIDVMKKKPRPLNENILTYRDSMLILFLGTIATLIGLGIFSMFEDISLGRSAVFTYIVLYETILIYIIRNRYKIQFLSNKYLHLSVILTLLLQFLIVFTPLSSIFNIKSIDLNVFKVLIFGLLLFMLFYIIYINFIEKFIDLSNKIKKNVA